MEQIINKYITNEQYINSSKLKKLLIKQNILPDKCNKCGLTSIWQDEPINLHLHHRDGNNRNNVVENLEILCPNCHSQTHNYSGKKKQKAKHNIISEQEIIDAIKTSYNKRQALLKLGLCSYGGSYQRINQIIQKYDLNFLENPLIQKRKEIELLSEEFKSTKFKEYQEKRLKTMREKYQGYDKIFQTKINWPSKEILEQMLTDKSCCQIAKELGVSDNAVRKRAKKYGIDVKSISKWSHKHNPRKK